MEDVRVVLNIVRPCAKNALIVTISELTANEL